MRKKKINHAKKTVPSNRSMPIDPMAIQQMMQAQGGSEEAGETAPDNEMSEGSPPMPMRGMPPMPVRSMPSGRGGVRKQNYKGKNF